MTTKPDWHIRLGEGEWSRFTYARAPADGIQLLGSIRKGLQIGALAVTNAGGFVIVNGDWLTPLNCRQVQSALNKAKAHAYRQLRQNQRMVQMPVWQAKRHPAVQYG